MANKAYVILYSEGYDEDDPAALYFPIKREGRDYAGMPQFFGGTKNVGESDRQCLARELAEESDRQLSLDAGGLYPVYHSVVHGDSYNFYVSTNWSGSYFLGTLQNEEMARIVRCLIDCYPPYPEDTEELCQYLNIVPSEAFSFSETYEAFNGALAWCCAD